MWLVLARFAHTSLPCGWFSSVIRGFHITRDSFKHDFKRHFAVWLVLLLILGFHMEVTRDSFKHDFKRHFVTWLILLLILGFHTRSCTWLFQARFQAALYCVAGSLVNPWFSHWKLHVTVSSGTRYVAGSLVNPWFSQYTWLFQARFQAALVMRLGLLLILGFHWHITRDSFKHDLQALCFHVTHESPFKARFASSSLQCVWSSC